MSEHEYNGLTLEGLSQRLEALTQRLEALEHENERVRSENTTLRHDVAALKGLGTERTRESVPALEGRVSWRSLLRNAGAAAGAAGRFLKMREAKAHNLDESISADRITTHHIEAESHGGSNCVDGRINSNTNRAVAVFGLNNGTAPAVRATNTASTGVAVDGTASSGNGVGVGVRGTVGRVQDVAEDSIAGVLGRNPTGTGVQGEGSIEAENVAGVRGLGKTGVWGSSSTTGRSGVYGQHTGSDGYGVVGDGKGTSTGVLGRNPSIGAGVVGEGGPNRGVGIRGKTPRATARGLAEALHR
jgi:hypothetical protein